MEYRNNESDKVTWNTGINDSDTVTWNTAMNERENSIEDGSIQK